MHVSDSLKFVYFCNVLGLDKQNVILIITLHRYFCGSSLEENCKEAPKTEHDIFFFLFFF